MHDTLIRSLNENDSSTSRGMNRMPPKEPKGQAAAVAPELFKQFPYLPIMRGNACCVLYFSWKPHKSGNNLRSIYFES